MQTQWIQIDGQFEGWLALPPNASQSGPGILLIQEIFGINDHIRAVAQQYALDGYVVLAPDLFHRRRPHVELGYDEAGMTEGFGHMQAIGMQTMADDLEKALATLRARPEVLGPVASIGYCMGGALSYLLGTRNCVDGAVCYYGGGIQDMLDAAVNVKGPMLLHYAQNDPYIPIEAVEKVSRALDHSGADLHVYPDVTHGFNCWARGSYNQQAAALAHGRTLEFLAAL